MQTVPRHEIDLEFAREQVDTMRQLVDSVMSDVEEEADEDALSSLRWRTVMRLEYLLAVDPAAADEETWRAAVLASEVANAVFAASSASDGTVTCEIGGKAVDLPALGPNRLSTAGDWITAAWLAVITQSERRIQELCAVDPAVLAGSGATYDDYVDSWVRTLRTFLRHEQVPEELFRTLTEQTDPDSLRYTPQEFMLWIAYPPIKLFYRLMLRDAEGFNDALAQALRLHGEYWSATDLAGKPDGFVAFGPLAIAVLASAVHLPVEVESDYLPAGLLDGRWVGR